jgi:hypothetical protein
MQGDVLAGGVPKRLTHRSGVWALEVVRQVAVERGVYRPVKQQLEGIDIILRYFGRSPQLKGLAQGAQQLLRAPSGDQNRSFDAVNGEWVPSVLAPSYVDELKRQQLRDREQTLRVQLLEVRTDQVRLNHANKSLLNRVSELEKRLEWLANELEVVRAQRPVVVQAAAPVEQQLKAAVVEAPTSVGAAAVAAIPDFPPLELPPADDLIRCLEQLIGGDVSAKEVAIPAKLPDAKDFQHVVSLLSDANDEIGAIFMDLKATVYLGGTLLMVPEGELTNQVRAKKPSEDSVAASSEVCNAMSGSLNNVSGNQHVRTSFLTLHTTPTVPWLPSARKLLALEDTFGGKLLLVAR